MIKNNCLKQDYPTFAMMNHLFISQMQSYE